MPGMTCHPGQKVEAQGKTEPSQTVAHAGGPVVLRPVSGSFPSSGSVWLHSNHGGKDDMPVVPACWTADRIVALIPSTNPGDGQEGEMYSVKIKNTSGTTVLFETSADVSVIGPAGNYPDPPMHFLALYVEVPTPAPANG